MTIKKTPLHSWHMKNAKMVPFAGFDMPVVYNTPSSISAEHMAVRDNAGIFDVSHMGRMFVRGKDALKFLNLIIPRDLSKTPVGKVAYCYFLNENAGFRDDLTVAHVSEGNYMLTWNAGNLQKIRDWIFDLEGFAKSIKSLDFKIEDISEKTAMIAFQGPKAPELIEKLFGVYPGSWKFAEAEFQGIKLYIMGSGYTGEAGSEITIFDTSVENPDRALTVWNAILETFESEGVKACGLGSRDTLRMEAGMPLYGNDMDETITPEEVGLAFPVLAAMDKDFFIGKHALKDAKENPRLLRRVGIIATKKGRSPRHGMKVFDEEKEIGWVCSGAFSPLFKKGMGFAYIPQSYDPKNKTILKVGDEISRTIEVEITGFPLYNPDEYGSKRK